MQRYLLFDGGCSVCTNLAQAIERETGGKLTARSLRDTEVQHWLNRAKPGWQWEPTLLEVHGEVIRAYTGLKMRARLVTDLGLRHSWRIYKLVREANGSVYANGLFESERRTFLKKASATVAAMAFVPTTTSQLQRKNGVKIENLPPDRELVYLTVAKESEQFQQFATSLAENHAGVFVFDPSHGRVLTVSSANSEPMFLVNFPISGGAGYSSYTLIFKGSSLRIKEDIASLFVYDEDSNILAHVVKNGKTVVDATISPDGGVIDEGVSRKVDEAVKVFARDC